MPQSNRSYVRRLCLAASLLVMIVAIGAGPSATSTPIPVPEMDTTTACVEPVTNALHVPVVDADDPIAIDIAVVLDRGVPDARVRSVLAEAQQSYTPLGITLRVTSVRKVALEGAEATELLDQLEALFVDGERPKGADVVMAFTPVDMTLTVPGAGPNTGVAGLADCVGGIRFPEHAFLIAEIPGDLSYGFGPVTFLGGAAAKIAAHELGHLLGGQHHLADCVEGVPSETERGEVSPCTLMSNFADFDSHNFGVLDGQIVRGHAEEWARP